MATLDSGSTFIIETQGAWSVTNALGPTPITFSDDDGDWLIDDGEVEGGAQNDKGVLLNVDINYTSTPVYFILLDDGTLYASESMTANELNAALPALKSAISSGNNYSNFAFCFALGTELAADNGVMEVSNLKVGDLVQTRDNGLQAIRWIGSRAVSKAELEISPTLRPIVINANALGPNLPSSDLTVSPQHRMFVDDYRAELLFGEPEILVPAKALKNDTTIGEDHSGKGVTYFHILFDKHELVKANGCWSESFHPGTQGLKAVDEAAKDELFKLFPELETGNAGISTCRPAIKVSEATLLQ